MSIGREEVETLNISDDNVDDDTAVAGAASGAAGEAEDRGDDHIDPEAEGRDDGKDDDADGDAAIAALAESVTAKDGEGKGVKDDEGDEDDDPKRVPYSRFKEVNDEVRLLRDRLVALEGKTATPAKEEPGEAAFDLKAMTKARNAAILEGDEDKAFELDEQINAHTLAVAEERAEARIAFNEMKREVETISKDAYVKYPFLDNKSKDANVDAITEVQEFRDLYRAKGDSWPVALQKAVDKIGKLYAKPVAKEPVKEEGKEEKKPITKIEERKVAAIDRNAKVEKQIPPIAGGASGEASKRVDISKLSEKEYQALPEEEKRRARGDYA